MFYQNNDDKIQNGILKGILKGNVVLKQTRHPHNSFSTISITY